MRDLTELAEIAGLYVLLVLVAIARASVWVFFRVLDLVLSGLVFTCLVLAIAWLIAG